MQKHDLEISVNHKKKATLMFVLPVHGIGLKQVLSR